MTLRTQTVRQRLLASTIIGGAAILALHAAPALAQEEPTTVDAIVVTGSRIVRQDFEAISPVTTVSSEQLELTGTLTVEALLNELPQIVPGNTRTSNNAGGQAFSTLDLRGLGPNRTLILVNGERVPAAAANGVVDINTIPTSLISRIEVVTGGASAVYGSDAVAGVVNFILNDKYEGAELSATYNASFDGKAPEIAISGLLGGNFANGRGNMTAYAAYYNRESVSQSEFDYARVSGAACYDAATQRIRVCDSAAEAVAFIGGPDGIMGTADDTGAIFAAGGSATPAWGVVTNSGANPFQNLAALLPATFGAGNTDTNCDGIPGGAINGGSLSFNDAGQLTPSNTQGACGVPDRSAGSTRYSFAPDNFLIIPAERFNMTTTLNYDITDNIRAKVMLSYANSASEVQLAPTPATNLSVTLTPAMQALIQANAPDLWVALNSRPNAAANFTLQRRMNEVGTRNAFNENNSFYMLSTVDGDFNDNWNWSLTASFGSSRFDIRGTNSVNATALRQGLAGCQTAAGAPLGTSALPGCVPLDLFGPNTMTQAMVNFVTVDTFSETQVEESRVAGFVRGNLLELPAGPVAAVFGFEYRDTGIDFEVDNEQRSGNIFGFNAIQAINGAIQVSELYGEISVPLIKDAPMFHYLGLEGGYRSSDYSSAGQVETYKIGGEWAPVDWLRFRAVYNEATRAPSVFELFRNGDQGFPAYLDPCRATNTAGNIPLQNFCVNQGVPLALIPTFTASNSQVQAFAFGNPNLSPEVASTWTAGFVFQPDWFPLGDFRMTVDWYQIEIEDAISAQGAQFWINQCYGNLNPGDPGCARITRDPVTGQVTAVNTTIANLSSQATEGVDIQAEWSVNLEDTFLGIPGRLRVNELLSLIDSYEVNGTDFVGTTSAAIGGAIFDWKSTLSIYYSLDDWMVFARWSYVPELCDPTFATFSATATACLKTDTGQFDPAASYIDVSARWNVTDTFQVTGVVNNLFDEGVPQTPAGLFSQANTDPQVYRVLGRTFSVSATIRF
jgi:iron complex outermembrane receptor protein